MLAGHVFDVSTAAVCGASFVELPWKRDSENPAIRARKGSRRTAAGAHFGALEGTVVYKGKGVRQRLSAPAIVSYRLAFEAPVDLRTEGSIDQPNSSSFFQECRDRSCWRCPAGFHVHRAPRTISGIAGRSRTRQFSARMPPPTGSIRYQTTHLTGFAKRGPAATTKSAVRK